VLRDGLSDGNMSAMSLFSDPQFVIMLEMRGLDRTAAT
jgi:hypothetical protein